MLRIEKYIFRIAVSGFLASLLGLTAVIWLTQALLEFDLLTTKGQSVVMFLTVTGLTIPSLIMLIAPFALFAAVLYTLNKLNGDSELIVMSAAGMSAAQLLRPFVTLALAVSILVGSISFVIMPWSFREIRDLVTQIRADFLTRVVREGAFTTLDIGFVFHYRERGPGGELKGVFMQDRRDPQRISTYLAETGQTAEVEGQNYLVLDKGSIQRQQVNSRDAAIIVFERYALDLAQFAAAGEEAYKPRERSTWELFNLNMQEDYVARYIGRFRAELHDRFVNPLYPWIGMLIAFAALGQARTTRQGRGMAIFVAVLVFGAIRLAGVGASSVLARSGWALILVYGIPFLSIGGAVYAIFGGRLPEVGLGPFRDFAVGLAERLRARVARAGAR